ncbi:MAG: type IV toxin-antitoxin system AbiEi family antitoxin domain-containing protein [Candidatus Delongbacteria bacterium]|nr:type IV toxin-antitoxin system AbiEi family antitoxin domain-containing protein [Candidatus Delongbacteria bacterium]
MKQLPDPIMALLQRSGVARSSELAVGASRSQITRWVRAGLLMRASRGLYALPAARIDENWSLRIVANRSPRAVFCLLTALRLHGLTTQSPFEVWIALGNKGHVPRLDHPPIRAIRFSQESLVAGVEELEINGSHFRVTCIAKTIADCFKYRSKVGLDVAMEALKDARRKRMASTQDLWEYAQINRVGEVMRPYLEMVE